MYSLGHYAQNIIGKNMDQTGYCTEVDGSLLQGEIFLACVLIQNKALWRSPALLHQSWSICQVFTAVTCKLTGIALGTCKCTITGGKKAPRSEKGGSQWAQAYWLQQSTFAWISCSAYHFRCHHSLGQVVKPERWIVGTIWGVNMGVLY